MGFFQNVKNKLGIGGVNVSLQVPGQVAKDSGVVEGKITLTSKSEQEIVSYTVKMLEEYTTGRGDEKETKELELGKIKIPESFIIKPGETKELTFSLPFALIKSNNDELKEKGGALGTLGKLGSFANNEKSKYFVDADVDVKSAALDPSDKKEIRIV
ncbi:MAG: sporulation protein [Bacteroidota bacterium]